MEKDLGLKILIASGNDYPGKMLSDSMRQLGHRAIWALRGDMALENARRSPDFDGLLSELDLPDMTGFALAGRISEILGHSINAHLFDTQTPNRVRMNLIIEAGCSFRLLPIKREQLLEILEQMRIGSQ